MNYHGLVGLALLFAAILVHLLWRYEYWSDPLCQELRRKCLIQWIARVMSVFGLANRFCPHRYKRVLTWITCKVLATVLWIGAIDPVAFRVKWEFRKVALRGFILEQILPPSQWS